MREPAIYKLKHPIKIGTQEITQLTFRPLKAKDMRNLPSGEIDQTLALIGRLSGQTDIVVDELSAEDLSEVSSIVASFLPSSQATGKEPSA